jgi:pyrroline-5-carboxylate reductase
MRDNIGIIGFGNMGAAIADNIRNDYEVFVFDKQSWKLAQARGMFVVGSNSELVKSVDTVIIAVKPQDLDEVLEEAGLFAKNKLFISIAAGIKTTYIENKLAHARVVRAMPNLGAITGNSITCICKGKSARQEDGDLARGLFSYIGKVQEVIEDEMDAVTAISGSGPGYYFDAVVKRSDDYKKDKDKFIKEFIVSLEEAAKKVGLNESLSKLLAEETAIASDIALSCTKSSAEELRDQVASKGGTTEAALEVLHKGGSLVDAARAAVERAKKLSRG